jgi:hypothetical protein
MIAYLSSRFPISVLRLKRRKKAALLLPESTLGFTQNLTCFSLKPSVLFGKSTAAFGEKQRCFFCILKSVRRKNISVFWNRPYE